MTDDYVDTSVPTPPVRTPVRKNWDKLAVDDLADGEVLELTDDGRFGEAIVGKPLADRAAAIKAAQREAARVAQQHDAYKRSGHGRLGPAIIGDELHREAQAHIAANPGIIPEGDEFSHGYGKSSGKGKTRSTRGRGRSKKRRE